MSFTDLPPTDAMPARPEVWCDEPLTFWGPFAERGCEVHCAMGKGHTNDHMAVFGSEDHEPPVTVVVRW